MRRGSRLAALALVVGPGILAGLSDDDPAGITTYSILGTDYGYRLLWVLLLSTAALIVFHELGARMGIATGQGLAGLIRERYGVRLAGLALIGLLVANIGTMCAEFAGVAASLELAGITRYLSVPLAAAGVSYLVLKGSFHGSNGSCWRSARCSLPTSSRGCSPGRTGAQRLAAWWFPACPAPGTRSLPRQRPWARRWRRGGLRSYSPMWSTSACGRPNFASSE
jgi:hypothetical protein